MPTQVSLLDGALASAGTLAIQTNGTTSAITISSAQVATFVNNPIMTGLTASRAVFTDGSKGLTSNAITGTGNVVMSASPTLTGTIDGAALTLSSSLTLSGGTANGVLYLNGSKVATSGSALTFDGTYATIGTSGTTYSVGGITAKLSISGSIRATGNIGVDSGVYINAPSAVSMAFVTNDAEQMRLTSTGLGIGTSSPSEKLQVNGSSVLFQNTSGAFDLKLYQNSRYDGRITVNSSGMEISQRQGLPLLFLTSDTERMRLDSSGNLGLGVTPSTSWASDPSATKAFQLSGGSIWSYSTSQFNLLQNAVWNGSNLLYANTAAASAYRQISGAHSWYTAPSGTAGNAITFTQAMTLDASGNLGIGTTSPSVKLQVQDSAGSNPEVRVLDGTVNSQWYAGSNGTCVFGTYSNHPLVFRTNGTEAARITSGGDLLVGTTSVTSYIGSTVGALANVQSTNGSNTNAFVHSGTTPYGAFIYYPNATPNGTINQFLVCQDSSAVRFQLRSNGGLGNYSANDVNLSDRREKTNFAPAGEYLSKICAIPVQTFNYIDQNLDEDPGTTLGVVAQDVQAVAPELVMESNWGTKEEPKMRLSIYQTDLQYALMKCIQEQQAIIEQLKADVAALKGA